MFLLLDNFDSFTHILADYLAQGGAECRVLRNNVPLAEIRRHDYAGVVLSPGPGVPRQAGNLMEVIGHYAGRLPILGICLGHQALGEYFGAALGRAARPMHGKVSRIWCQPDEALFANVPPSVEVVRYHSLVLTRLPDCLQPLAQTENGELMAFRHKTLPVRGIQFHPEAALTECGLQMANNWLNFARKT
ncbi:MAG: aminodeoxychorismate/anthranilate synthase component II [Cytophagales bacterium]|nr:aminodeoxychorismate/anthranilate synthase component II [Cytophagales bacterium]